MSKSDKFEILCEGKFLRYQMYHYVDPNGVSRQWEGVERTTRKTDIDAIDIIATNSDNELILVKQYRPPTKSYCIEFPSGLVDDHETPEEAALRELKEETGCIGKVVFVSPITMCEPGITNESSRFVHVEVTERKHQELDPTEFIEILTVKRSDLFKYLNNAVQEGVSVDGRLYSFALASQLKN